MSPPAPLRALIRAQLVLACLALVGLAAGQELRVHGLAGIEPPCELTSGPRLARGAHGFLWAVCPGEVGDTLRYHDGERWRDGGLLRGRSSVVPEVSGRLVVQNGRHLIGLEVTRGRVRHHLLAALPDTQRVNAVAIDPRDHRRLAFETAAGTSVSLGPEREPSPPRAGHRLLAFTRGGAFTLGPDHTIGPLDGRRQALGGGAAGRLSARAAGAEGGAAFALGDSAYLVVPGRAPRSLPLPFAAASLLVHRHYVYAVAPQQRMQAARLGGGGWKLLRRSDDGLGGEGRDYALGAGAPVGDRVVVTAAGGLVGIEQTPAAKLELDLPHEPVSLGRSLPGSADPTDIVTLQRSAVARFDHRRSGSPALLAELASTQNLMRFSSPSAAVYHGDSAHTVATSDGRVLQLHERWGAREVLDLRAYGSSVSDLVVGPEGGLWGAFDPSGHDNAGLFRHGPDGSFEVYGKPSGLPSRVSGVRFTPAGRPVVGAVEGDVPMYRYRRGSAVWIPVQAARGQRLGQVHEVAPVDDTLTYLATSRGLFRHSPAGGYREVMLPHYLQGLECVSVLADGGAVWFVLAGRGAYWMRGGELVRVDGEDDWRRRSFGYRGLRPLGGGSALLADGEAVYRLDAPYIGGVDDDGAAGVVRLGRRPRGSRYWASDSPLWHRAADSLYVTYTLPGFATDRVVASFALDGRPLVPARETSGTAVFADLEPGLHNLEVRLSPLDVSVAAAYASQVLDVRAAWYLTRGGVLIIVGWGGFTLLLIVLLAQRQQRHRARWLAALVAERTAELADAHAVAQRNSRAKSIFLASMSHEIRTPLNAVLGMATVLADTDLDGEQRATVAAIRAGGLQLEGIVENIMAFNQVESGTVRRRLREVDPGSIFTRVLRERAADVDAAGLFLGYDLGTLPDRARVDADKLAAIVGHLLDNAIKFTDRGSVRLAAGFRPDPLDAFGAGAGQLWFEVHDTGCGLDPTDVARVFEVFEQADNSSTRRHGGAGLGLAIVRTYVDCLGGTVGLRPAPDGGTVARVELPVGMSTPAEVAASRCVDDEVQVCLVGGTPEWHEQLGRELAREGVSAVPIAAQGAAVCHAALVILDGETPASVLARLPTVRALLAAGRPVSFVGMPRRIEAADLESQAHVVAYPLGEDAVAELAQMWRRASSRAPKSPPAPQTPAARAQAASLAVGGGGALAPASPVGGSAGEDGESRAGFVDLAAEVPLRILVAEDNAINKLLALKVLARLGYEADWAPDGRAAVERHAKEAYDFIFMDVHMPALDGLDATRAIRRGEVNPTVFICALTANATEEGYDECIAAGMDDFISKPLKVERLVEVIRSTRARRPGEHRAIAGKKYR